MRAPYTQLYVHLIWATWDREAFIGSELEPQLFAVLGGKAHELGAQTLAIGGDFDHVHVLTRFSPSVAIATLIGEMKGASSHWVNFVWRPSFKFRWQGGYGAFTVSPFELEAVENYIRNQKQHHATRELWVEWEKHSCRIHRNTAAKAASTRQSLLSQAFCILGHEGGLCMVDVAFSRPNTLNPQTNPSDDESFIHPRPDAR